MVNRPWEKVQAAQKSETKITQHSSQLCQYSPRSTSSPNKSQTRLNGPPKPSNAQLITGASRNRSFRWKMLNFLSWILTLQPVFWIFAFTIHGYTARQKGNLPNDAKHHRRAVTFWLIQALSCIISLQYPLHLMEISRLVKVYKMCWF